LLYRQARRRMGGRRFLGDLLECIELNLGAGQLHALNPAEQRLQPFGGDKCQHQDHQRGQAHKGSGYGFVRLQVLEENAPRNVDSRDRPPTAARRGN
jgi:hypothetical protein